MSNKLLYFSALVFAFAVASCKTQFEQIRTSGDPEKMFKSANRYYKEGDYLKAQTLYELVIPFYRGKEQAEELFYKYAYTYYNMNEYILAAHYFNSFTTTFYNSPKKEEAAFMSAYSNYKLSPNYRLDQSYSEDAIDELQSFINLFPSSPRVDECNELINEIREKLEKKAFEQGKLYFQLENYISAMTVFENMLKDFPETQNAEQIRYLIMKSSFNLAVRSIYEKKRERFEETVNRSLIFQQKFPDSEWTGEARTIESICNNEIKKFIND